MKKLDKLRKDIDLIDDKILKLLQNRSKIALEIGDLKNKNSKNSNLYRPERQIRILNRLLLKKNKLFTARDILKFWKEIFFHQTNLQGRISFFVPETLNSQEKNIIFSSLGSEIKIETFKNLIQSQLSIKKNKDKYLILPYPGKIKKSSWWIDKNFKDLFIISAIPLINKNKIKPRLVILSKNRPIIDADNSYIYMSSVFMKEDRLKKINQLNSYYLYLSKTFLNSDKVRFLGSYPNLKI